MNYLILIVIALIAFFIFRKSIKIILYVAIAVVAIFFIMKFLA